MPVFWAKTTADGQPGIDVFTHGLYVGSLAQILVRQNGLLGNILNLAPEQAAFLAAGHDCGKIQRGFVCKCPAWLEAMGWRALAERERWNKGFGRHEFFSQSSLTLFLMERGICDEESARFWAAAVGAHHGRVQGIPYCFPYHEPGDAASGVDWEAERQNMLERFWRHFGSPRLPEIDGNSPALWALAGLITLADWIGSNEKFFPADVPLPEDVVLSRAEETIHTLALGPPSVRRGLGFSDIFPFEPNALQRMTADVVTGPGVYVLEAPMGQGKTEAALWAAYRLMEQGRASGIYFALPTQATSNRMHLRLREFASRVCPDAPGPRLIHGSSWLRPDLPQIQTETGQAGSEEADADTARQWFASSRRALLAPLGVGTADQALMAVAARYFALRRYALAGKVIILDEVHSYDLYTGTLVSVFCRELERLSATVIVLSATLTSKARADLLDLPAEEVVRPEPPALLSACPLDRPASAHAAECEGDKSVEIGFASGETLLDRCVQAVGAGSGVLWICDTVDAAQAVFDALKDRVNPADRGLLHSRFPLFQRERLEEEWLERFGKNGDRRRGAVLVSTQIVEQSVDIDADLLITELAPSDMLLQRLGRLQRHPRKARPCAPQCLIVEESARLEELRAMREPEILAALGSKARVYSPYTLLRTLEVWQDIRRRSGRVQLPDDIRPILARTYAEPESLPEAWEKLSQQNEGRGFAQRAQARMNANIWTMTGEDEERFRTRLSDYPTRRIILSVGGKDSDGRRTLLNGEAVSFPRSGFRTDAARALARNAVNIPAYHLEGAAPPPELKPYHADAWGEIGDDGRIRLSGLKGKVSLAWDELAGVRIS